VVALGVAATAAVLSIPASANATFAKVSTSSKDYPQRVDWVTACTPVKTAPDDPIVFPGQPGRSHLHVFSGNRSVTASSTALTLAKAPTTCTNAADHASYWMPALMVNGVRVNPYTTRAYYRAGTYNGRAIVAPPFGLKMVAGDAMAMAAQHANIAGFHCRIPDQGAVVGKQSLPPQCPGNSILEASVVFPNCWDGHHLDSANHRTHMSYATNYKCDAAHPVQIPQLTIAERFPAGSTHGKITLASMNSPYTLHADFINAWAPAVLKTLVVRCINAGVACADVSDRRFPPAP
jgi:hypothetical protein